MVNNNKSMAKTRLVFSIISFITLLIGVLLGVGIANIRYARFNDKNIGKIITVYDTLRENWIYANDYEEFDKYLTEWAIEGMTNDNKDPYTFYTANYDQQGLGTSYKGIGISHAFYGGDRIINHVFNDSPANRAGLKKGDIITGIYESSTSDDLIEFSSLGAQEALDVFSNYKEDVIKLRVKQNDGLTTRDFTITKGDYEQTAVSSYVGMNHNKVILTITVQNFLDSNMVKDFRDAINKTIENYSKIDELIIDLRDNGGGRTDYASALASMFIPEGSIICKYELKDGTIIEDVNYSKPYFANIPQIKFLQNHGTASASEMFILALKDNMPDQVQVIGTNSYGKGIRQTVMPLSDGSFIRYTDAKVLSPKGYSIHGVGIEPTTRVEYNYDLMNYYGEIGFVTKEYQTKILAQINGVLGSSYPTYQEGLDAYLISRYPSQSEFNYLVGRSLQKDGYDMYIQAMNNIKSIALGE